MAEDKFPVDNNMVSLNAEGHLVIKDPSVIEKLQAQGIPDKTGAGPNNIVWVGVG